MAKSWYLRLVGVVRMTATPDSAVRESRAIGSRKGRTLLALLGAHDRVVSMAEVVDALWVDDAPPRDPEANVATLVSRLRGRFGPDVVVGSRRGYQLGDIVQVDLRLAATHIRKAEHLLRSAHPAHGLLVAEQAIRLLDHGLALAEHGAAEWAEPARETQAALLRRSRHVAAECSLRTNAPRLAQALAETLVAVNPRDEAAYRLLTRARASRRHRMST